MLAVLMVCEERKGRVQEARRTRSANATLQREPDAAELLGLVDELGASPGDSLLRHLGKFHGDVDPLIVDTQIVLQKQIKSMLRYIGAYMSICGLYIVRIKGMLSSSVEPGCFQL